jgi:hypothetical protein
MALGGGSATPRAKKKIENFRIWPFGVAEPPPRAMGWLWPPQIGSLGWLKPPLGSSGLAGNPPWGGRPPQFFLFDFNVLIFLFLFSF